METIISRFYHIIQMIAIHSATHLVRCCHGQMSLIAASYPIIFIHVICLKFRPTPDYRGLHLPARRPPPSLLEKSRSSITQTFAGGWIGHGGLIAWLPRFPDQTPLDFFLWGFVKDLVYSTRVAHLQVLQTQ